jgi:PAS domain S-box-containing protein
MSKSNRILVVDDEERNRDLLELMLEALGYECEMARNGLEALERMNPGIDLLLLDVRMPDIDGFEVARRIRSHPEYSDTPIIMVTFLTGKEDRLAAVMAGANDFISKPIDKVELRVRIASLLKMKEAQDAVKLHRKELESTVRIRTAALKATEERYRTLFEDSLDAIVTCSPDGSITDTNQALLDLAGYREDEPPPETMVDLCADAEDPRRFRHEMEQKGCVKDFEWKLRRKDGTKKDCLVTSSLHRDPSGNVLSYQSIIHDITERKKAEDALRESEERFRMVFEGARDSIFMKDRDLKYTHVNPAMIRSLDTTPNRILGKTDEGIFDLEASKNLRNLELRVLGGQEIEAETTVGLASGPVTFNCSRVPIKDSSGTVVGLCGIARDITERKERELDAAHHPGEYPSRAMHAVLKHAKLAADSDSIVLLLGESGSGKDHLARFLHNHSRRAAGPFFTINCAAVAPELAESELFGHEPGSFTGSRGRKRGLLELAEGGTLLLNEIGELSPQLQAKLLTFLDTQSFTRVGGERTISVNARLVAATNRDLEKEVERGNFRKDLYYRLNVFSIEVPPLRRRIEDLPILARGILKTISDKMGLPKIPRIAPDAIEAFGSYHWPGNVRELRNVLERSMIVGNKEIITSNDVGISHTDKVTSGDSDDLVFAIRLPHGSCLTDALTDAKRHFVKEGLLLSEGSVKDTADLLGISRDQLKYLMKSLGIRRENLPTKGDSVGKFDPESKDL